MAILQQVLIILKVEDLQRKSKLRDLEDMVYRMSLTYDEIVDILDVKYIVGSTNVDTLEPSIYEVSDINFMFKSLLPDEVQVKITIDDI